MTFDPNKSVQTRDGRPARILATDVKGGPYTIAAAIGRKRGCGEYVSAFTSDGCYFEGKEGENDLVNVPERKSLWFNEYAHRGGSVYGAYDTRETADDAVAWRDRAAVVELIFEDGKLVDFKRWETNDGHD